MPLIDFDSLFTDYLRAWLEENQDHYDNYEQVELLMPELYEAFANTPADFLGGLSPLAHFARMTDPQRLVNLISAYLEEGVPLPDLLLRRVAELGKEAEQPLMALLLDADAGMEARMVCVRLLQDIDSTLPLATYIHWQLEREDHDDLADFAIESLEEMGETAVQPMLEALEEANDLGREALLSVLSRYPDCPGVYEALIRLFDALPERQAILAAYLGRLGDARALPVLSARCEEEGLSYLDYIELRSAIEALGGEAPARKFDDDPEYEALRGMD